MARLRGWRRRDIGLNVRLSRDTAAGFLPVFRNCTPQFPESSSLLPSLSKEWGERDHTVLQVHNFTYGLLTPGLAYVMSCMGAFIGLRCTARARAFRGVGRLRWLLLGGVSIGVTGI